jgi:hypothetical protein
VGTMENTVLWVVIPGSLEGAYCFSGVFSTEKPILLKLVPWEPKIQQFITVLLLIWSRTRHPVIRYD